MWIESKGRDLQDAIDEVERTSGANLLINDKHQVMRPIKISKGGYAIYGEHPRSTWIVALSGGHFSNGQTIFKIDDPYGRPLEYVDIKNIGIFNKSKKQLTGISARRMLMSRLQYIYIEGCTSGGVLMDYGSHDNVLDRIMVNDFDGYGINLAELNHATTITGAVIRAYPGRRPSACIGIGTSAQKRSYASAVSIHHCRMEVDNIDKMIYAKAARGLSILNNYMEIKNPTTNTDFIWLGRARTIVADVRGGSIMSNHFQGNHKTRNGIWARRCRDIVIKANHIRGCKTSIKIKKQTTADIEVGPNYD